MATPTTFMVVLDADAAVIDLAKDIKSSQEVKAILNVIDKLRQLGPQLVPPHAKSLKGQTDLFELRPRQGSSPCRPIYTCRRVLHHRRHREGSR